MRRLATWAAVVAAAAVPVSAALAHSIQSPSLPDGRLQIKGSGYIDVQFNKKTKKFNYVQVYYPGRAAGPARSKYPAYLSLTTNPRTGLHGPRLASGLQKREQDHRHLGSEGRRLHLLRSTGLSAACGSPPRAWPRLWRSQ